MFAGGANIRKRKKNAGSFTLGHCYTCSFGWKFQNVQWKQLIIKGFTRLEYIWIDLQLFLKPGIAGWEGEGIQIVAATWRRKFLPYVVYTVSILPQPGVIFPMGKIGIIPTLLAVTGFVVKLCSWPRTVPMFFWIFLSYDNIWSISHSTVCEKGKTLTPTMTAANKQCLFVSNIFLIYKNI